MRVFVIGLLMVLLTAVTPAAASPILFSAAGPTTASIQAQVDAFRAALGPLNPNSPVSLPFGRRQIDWDAVPEGSSSPNAFPGDFFNGNVAGRARGIVFSTPGSGFQVSANTGPGIQFGNLNPSYPDLFDPFSPNKLFTPVGSTITEAVFRLPSDQVTPTTVHGFGVVFSDVDRASTTSIELFNASNVSLGVFFAPATSGNGTFSFLGILFNDGARIGRVRITSGNVAPGGNELLPGLDAVVMDDFIYGEPGGAPVPEPVTLLLTSSALIGIWAFRRKAARG